MTETELRNELMALSDLLRAQTLHASTLNDALTFARLYARLHWDNISGFFSDEDLEQALFEHWKNKLPGARLPKMPPVDFLHVVTQVYDGGGHSRLLRQLVAGLNKEGSQGILFAGKGPKDKAAGLPDCRSVLQGSPAQRLADLVHIAAQAKTVILHHHPDDIVVAMAARLLREQGSRVLFVNHADHVFGFGPGAADVTLDICMTGTRTTRDRRSALSQSFMGIPVVQPGQMPQPHEAPRSGAIVSMGGPGKFKPFPGLSFPDFLSSLLRQVPNDVILIGPSDKDPWWAEVCAAFPGRISLRGPLPPSEVEPILQKAACYVDSFPLDGGTAYPQAAFQGLPCFGPNSQAAPGVSPADALRFDTPQQMETALVAYLQGGDYPFDLEAVRHQIADDFSTDRVVARVLGAAKGQITPIFDYLQELGQRDSDYNARRWVEAGQLNLPKRIRRHLSLGARLRVARALSSSPLRPEIKAVMKKRFLFSWL